MQRKEPAQTQTQATWGWSWLNPLAWSWSKKTATQKETVIATEEKRLQEIANAHSKSIVSAKIETTIQKTTTTAITAKLNDDQIPSSNPDTNNIPNPTPNTSLPTGTTLKVLLDQVSAMRAGYETDRQALINKKAMIYAHDEPFVEAPSKPKKISVFRAAIERIKSFILSGSQETEALNKKLNDELEAVSKQLEMNSTKLKKLLNDSQSHEKEEKEAALALCDEKMEIINDMIIFATDIEAEINYCLNSEHFVEGIVIQALTNFIRQIVPFLPLPSVSFQDTYQAFLAAAMREPTIDLFQKEGEVQGLLMRADAAISQYIEKHCNKEQQKVVELPAVTNDAPKSSVYSGNITQYSRITVPPTNSQPVTEERKVATLS